MRHLTVFCVLLGSLSAALAQMTHEETRVRTAYAKLAYAVEQGTIGELAMEANNPLGMPIREEYASMTSEQRMAAAEVSFTLADFVIGDVRDIVRHKMVDLITPDWDLVDVLSTDGNQGANYNDNGLATGWKSLELHWKPLDPRPLEHRIAVEGFTLAEVYQLEASQGDLQAKDQPLPEGLWQRYASYSVTVSFQGKTRGPYKALFLFGTDPKGNVGNEKITVYDPVVGRGLGYAMSHPLFPEAFVVTRLRNLPLVMNWLHQHQIPSGPSCLISTDKGDICCDLTKMKCGPKSEDVAAGLAKSLPDGSALKVVRGD
jgi:hypothetical protein